MKKIFTLFAIFLILICISSFSWAFTSSEITVDVSSLNASNFTELTFNLVDYDFSLYNYIYIGSQSGVNDYQGIFTKEPLYFVQNDGSNKLFVTYSNTLPFTVDTSGVISFPFSPSNGQYGDYFRLNPSNNSLSNGQLYTDNSYTTTYQMNNFTSNPSIIADNSSGNEEEETDEGLLAFISNFFDNLLHLVVPDAEDWQEVQNSFELNILDRFDIDTWSFNDNLNVEYSEELGIFEPRYSAPYFDFGAFGVLRLDGINDLLNTPISLGKMDTHYDEAIGPTVELQTNGVTIRDLINYLLAIEIFILNILLYNKFFAKGE